MTFVQEGVALGADAHEMVEASEFPVAEGPAAEPEAPKTQPLTAEQLRHQQICRVLGHMAPRGLTVIDYRVEGWQGICSPVQGKIIVTTSTTPEGGDLNEMVVHPTDNREPISDFTIFDDLNAMAEKWRADQKQEVLGASSWHRDK